MRDRFIGCLLGAAIGDKLGMRLEGATHQQIRNQFGSVTGYIEPCETTDDTELTVLLAQSLIDSNGFDPSDFAEKLKRCRSRYLGWTTSEALYLLRHGVSWQESGQYSTGDGAAMRSAPMGLFYWHDPWELKALTVESARITHNHPRAMAGAVAVAFSVARALFVSDNAGFLDDGERFLENVSSFIHDIDMDMAAALKDVGTIIDYNRLGKRSTAIEAVPAALYCFVKSPDNFEKTVLTAVNGGGDTDTISSMAGAISGAYNGVKGIPDRFLRGLEQTSELTGLSERLWRVAISSRST